MQRLFLCGYAAWSVQIIRCCQHVRESTGVAQDYASDKGVVAVVKC